MGLFRLSSMPERLCLVELAPSAIGIGKRGCLGAGEPAAHDARTVHKALGANIRLEFVEKPFAGCQVIQVTERRLQLSKRGGGILGARAGKERREHLGDVAKLLGGDASLVALRRRRTL